MINFTTNTYQMKREIVNFSKKICEGSFKPENKFVTDMIYGIFKSKDILLSSIADALDEDTKKRLAQGERIVEVLKQGEHQPLKVENQVMIIHAVTNDLLSDIPVNNISRFETELFQFININYPEIGKKILENGDFTQELTSAIKEFKKKFVIEA